MKNWIELEKEQPKTEGYYRVKFEDGQEDKKWFRIRPSKNIKGFLVEGKVVKFWKHLNK